MEASDSPEISFLRKGELSKLVRKDPAHAVSIALSILRGKTRDFSKDSLRLAKSIETSDIHGIENIPSERIPTIIACNHPDIYDLVAGTIHITQSYFEKRKEAGLPGDIHWMVAENIPPREARKNVLYKPVYGLIDWGMKKLDKTYGFTPVPIKLEGQNASLLAKRRAKSFLSAREILKDKPKDPNNNQRSRTIGIFPEGDITGMNASEFYDSVGLLASSLGEDTLVLPTRIFRDESNHLNVRFGDPFRVSPKQDTSEIANEVKISLL